MSAVDTVGLIDAGGANLGSVRYALERIGVDVALVRDADELAACQRVILPGVGAAAEGMARLHAQGLVEPLRQLDKPLLGICLGMQLLYEHSEEGHVDALGLLPGTVRRLRPATGIRVPHMGWNKLLALRESPLLDNIPAGASAYFVHSYAAPLSSHTVAVAHHGGLFTAIVQRDHFCGAQFHPERSAAAGEQLLRNFLAMDFS